MRACPAACARAPAAVRPPPARGPAAWSRLARAISDRRAELWRPAACAYPLRHGFAGARSCCCCRRLRGHRARIRRPPPSSARIRPPPPSALCRHVRCSIRRPGARSTGGGSTKQGPDALTRGPTAGRCPSLPQPPHTPSAALPLPSPATAQLGREPVSPFVDAASKVRDISIQRSRLRFQTSPVTHFHSQLLLSIQIVAAARGRGHRALLLLLQVASRGPEHFGEPPHCWPRRVLWSRAFRRRRHHPQKSCWLSTY
ncbi:hypothetical protein PVAP13_9NG120600 [Panicum virgatum]|uniref:Uncharacterized protein n=1 Tax=Panicum virgatum TaxID=38727 RepID=A0A8T0MGU4_PANVG|nr:hypothetical protein PVAP13_9NG120600 [Panicum virgatum]